MGMKHSEGVEHGYQKSEHCTAYLRNCIGEGVFEVAMSLMRAAWDKMLWDIHQYLFQE